MEGEARRLLDDVLQPLGIFEARHLQQHAILPLALDRRLGGTDLVDAVADHFHRLRDQRRHARGDAVGGQRHDDLAVGRLGERQFRHTADAETARNVVLQLLHRRHRGGLLRRIGQLDGDRIRAGGDQIADAIVVGERRAHVATQVLDPLGDDRVAVNLQQQVRAALQVETEHYGLLGQEAGPSGQDILGQEAWNSEQDAKYRNDDDDG